MPQSIHDHVTSHVLRPKLRRGYISKENYRFRQCVTSDFNVRFQRLRDVLASERVTFSCRFQLAVITGLRGLESIDRNGLYVCLFSSIKCCQFVDLC